MVEYIKREAAICIADYAANEHPYSKEPGKPETYSDYNQGWNDACDYIRVRLEKQPAADVAPVRHGKWISVKDRLPDTETEVLVAYNRNGFCSVCPAIYEDGTMLTQDSMWNWYELYNYGTYSEEHDDYFVPEGWWENRQFTPDDVYNSEIDCEVTHWMPLPELPKMDGEE